MDIIREGLCPKILGIPTNGLALHPAVQESQQLLVFVPGPLVVILGDLSDSHPQHVV